MTYPANIARNRDLILRYRAGEPPGKLAEDFGLTRQRIHAIIRQWTPKFEDPASPHYGELENAQGEREATDRGPVRPN